MLRSPRACIPSPILGVIGKLSTRRDAWALFHDVPMHILKVIEV